MPIQEGRSGQVFIHELDGRQISKKRFVIAKGRPKRETLPKHPLFEGHRKKLADIWLALGIIKQRVESGRNFSLAFNNDITLRIPEEESPLDLGEDDLDFWDSEE